MKNDLETLKIAVERSCDCKAHHARSEAVFETFRGDVVWDGMVEVFALAGAPGGVQRAYAWSFPQGEDVRHIAVLAKPPVSDAVSAVRAAIASGQMK